MQFSEQFRLKSQSLMQVVLIVLSLDCAALRIAMAGTSAGAVRRIGLPDASTQGVGMDYLAYERAHRRVWVPAGNTGSVDVIDTATESVTQIKGFPTTTVERNGTTRVVGPSSATVGQGTVYVGNRGDSSVCAIDAESLHVGVCHRLSSTPDGLAYVASTKEVWVTTPRNHSIVVLDAADGTALTERATIRLDGQPEGFAVDDSRGVFYTNLEDGDRTLAIDIHRRAVRSTWRPGCGEGGPKGLAVDRSRDLLFVACPDRVKLLDAAHDGRLLSTLTVGAGIDNIDYVESRRELYVAAARAAVLSVARLDRRRLAPVMMTTTTPGARNAVATDDGVAYLTDSVEGNILVVAPARK